MKKLLVTLLLCYLVTLSPAKAVDCEDVSKYVGYGLDELISCKDQLGKTAQAIDDANKTNTRDLTNLRAQIAKLKTQISGLETQLARLTKEVFDREVKVGVKEELLTAKVRRDYIQKRSQSLLLILFSARSANEFFKDLVYREKLARSDREIISSVSGEITLLTAQSSLLKTQKINLDALKKRVDEQAGFLAKEVDKANKYVSDLSGKVAALSARQQALLAEKTGTYATSVGDVPLADDPASRPDYNPGFSPAFAAFSFGAPHYKGMSQYGAFGRAKAGQNAETILHAYYGGIEIKKDYSTGINITVQGYGSVNIEIYVKRIYEMPTSWGDQGGFEALKAQAVAARSYALAYTNNGTGSICASENCQVYKNSNKGGKWDEAVDATRGWVLVSGGKPFSAWYASTSGGYQESYSAQGHTTPGFWDTTSDWTRWADGAWEKAGGSPWFYKGWYKTRSGKNCGKSHPWLSNDEFSDIVNAALVYANGGDASGIFPTETCLGSTGWSRDRMSQEADKYGGRVTSVNSVRVEHSQNGFTDKVVLGTNRGEVTINGANFVKVFNLRAPGAIHLKSGLFNIEKK
ncbi:MAG: SpoIID/LytB domain-containing protein [Patescibacteria group bacterium]